MQFEKDMQSDHKDLFLKARELLLSFEGVEEIKKQRITTYGTKQGGICHMRTMPYGIDFGFLKGARMDDENGLLTGKGKTLRVLPVTTFDASLVRYYVAQALMLIAEK